MPYLYVFLRLSEPWQSECLDSSLLCVLSTRPNILWGVKLPLSLETHWFL